MIDSSILRRKDFGFCGSFDWQVFDFVSSRSRFLTSFLNSTDITRQRNVEHLHLLAVQQRAEDAEEAKRNQELFVDMASHELRGPLNGVWQNAECVSGSLEHITDLIEDVKSGHSLDESRLDEILDELTENMEAVNSIMLCCSHQSRICEDIINVSKVR
jgi:signal transduction histidine kinase